MCNHIIVYNILYLYLAFSAFSSNIVLLYFLNCFYVYFFPNFILSFHVLIFFSTIALILLPLLLYFSFFYHCTHTSSITFVTSLFLPLHFHTSSIAFILHSFFLYHCTFIRNPFIKYFSLFIDTFPFSSTFE